MEPEPYQQSEALPVLGDDTLALCFQFLDVPSLARAEAVCAPWRDIIHSVDGLLLWQTQCAQFLASAWGVEPAWLFQGATVSSLSELKAAVRSAMFVEIVGGVPPGVPPGAADLHTDGRGHIQVGQVCNPRNLHK